MRNKELKRAQQKVNRFIHSVNRNLYEDVFKDRFSIHQVSRQDLCECGGFHFSNWCHSAYLIEFRDNEEPERNFTEWFDEYDATGFMLSPRSAMRTLNEFIIKSDFWDKWDNDEEYKKTHWYSGKKLEEYLTWKNKEKEFKKSFEVANE